MRTPRLERATLLDLLTLGVLLMLAAVLRLTDLSTRGPWDADQGHDMLVLFRFVTRGDWPLLGPPTSIGNFHHGALYYYLLAPAAWLGGSDPVVVSGAIALSGIAAVGLTWWIARAVAGPVVPGGQARPVVPGGQAGPAGGRIAGFVAGLVAAVSASAISESTFIWNPNLIAFSSALTIAAGWRAWTTRRARWWLLAAVGQAITMQSHLLGIIFLVPVAALLVADARRRPPGSRRALAGVGLGALAILLASYVPLAAYELGHDFAETRAIIAWLSGPGAPVALDPISRLLFVDLRIVAWPLTGLLTDALVPGVLAALGVLVVLVWRLRAAGGLERDFVRWLAFALLWSWIVLGLGVAGLATVTPLPVDHYHAFLDPLVFVLAGLGAAAAWGNRGQPERPPSESSGAPGERRPAIAELARASRLTPARTLVLVALGALLAWNVGHWPPSVAPDGGWPAAARAGSRIEASAGPGPIAFVSLPEFKTAEAYLFPLVRDRRAIGEPAAADTLAIVCDALFVTDCGGPAEDPVAVAVGFGYLVDRFVAAPGRTISIYRPA